LPKSRCFVTPLPTERLLGATRAFVLVASHAAASIVFVDLTAVFADLSQLFYHPPAQSHPANPPPPFAPLSKQNRCMFPSTSSIKRSLSNLSPGKILRKSSNNSLSTQGSPARSLSGLDDASTTMEATTTTSTPTASSSTNTMTLPPSSATTTTATANSSSSSGSNNNPQWQQENTLSSLQVEVVEVKNLPSTYPSLPPSLYVELQLGDLKLNANVNKTNTTSAGTRPEAVVFTQKKLADLYKESLKFTLINKDTNMAIGSSQLPVKKLMIGKKFEAYFNLAMARGGGAGGGESVQLRLSLELLGPLRKEFRFLSDLVSKYYSTVDRTLDGAAAAGHAAQPYVANKWTLPLLVPFGVLLLAASPFMGVALTIGLPVFLPLILLGLVGGLTMLIASIILALSSRAGRVKVEALVDPVIRKLTHTSTGQQLLYETGPRPSPLRVAKTFAPKGKWERLVTSVILDGIGCSSYLLPVLGELTDLAWAPLFAVCVHAMYSESSPYAHYVGLVEELLPFTDIIPTATLAWLRENGAALAKDLHISAVTGQRRGQGTAMAMGAGGGAATSSASHSRG